MFRAVYYEEFGASLEQGIACCPELQTEALKYRPEKTDWRALQKFELPAEIVTQESPCLKYVARRDGPTGRESPGQKWMAYRQAFSQDFWQKGYAALTEKLHDCCVQHFDQCLKAAQREYAKTLTPESGAVEACVQRWSPEHQPQVARSGSPAAAQSLPAGSGEPTAAAPADNPGVPADRRPGDPAYQVLLAERDGFRQEARRCQLSTNEMARTLAELRQSCEQQQAGEAQVREGLRDEITLLTRQNDVYQAQVRRVAEERDRLRSSLETAAPHPGSAVLAAFPTGMGSLELALYGGAALLMGFMGFLLGLPGFSRWRRRLQSGAGAALMTLLFCLGLVSLLPDTRSPILLLALGGAALLTSLRTLLRAAVLLRQQRQAVSP